MVSPPDIVGAAAAKPMQPAKSLSETWMLPVHGPATVWVVSVAGFIATPNVTATVVSGDTLVAASAGVVDATVGSTRFTVMPTVAAAEVAVPSLAVKVKPSAPENAPVGV